VRTKLTMATACPEDNHRRLALVGRSTPKEKAVMASGLDGRWHGSEHGSGRTSSARKWRTQRLDSGSSVMARSRASSRE
jgi:hypothetical protein